MIDTLEAEEFGPLAGRPLRLLDLAAPDSVARAAELAAVTQAIIVGVDRHGDLPDIDAAAFDALLTTAPAPPRPWAGVAPARLDERLSTIASIITQAPLAASMAMRVLRIGETMPFDAATQLESMAYSTLLGGAEFRRWRAGRQAAATTPAEGARAEAPFLSVTRDADLVQVELARPERRNSICARMRDALFGALAAVIDDPTRPELRLSGRGACFSVGGELSEFGSAGDLAQAHAVRVARSCAALLHRLADRSEVRLHGACIGSGIEIAAAAGRRIARPGTFCQLPELAMGLMPGAGGTVTLPRAIGRHRTAAMLLSARRIDTATALAWGLLTGLEPA